MAEERESPRSEATLGVTDFQVSYGGLLFLEQALACQGAASGHGRGLVTPSGAAVPNSPPCTNPMASERMRIAALIKSDDQVNFEAVKKLRMVVRSGPHSGRLGKLLLTSATRLCEDEELSKSFCDCFVGKSVATLAKTASALWRFAQWYEEHHVGSAIKAGESTIYKYMAFLNENGAPTTATSFLEAWRFLHLRNHHIIAGARIGDGHAVETAEANQTIVNKNGCSLDMLRQHCYCRSLVLPR